ncbi:MAG TPA: hypothetical protein DCM49_03940 [Lachnospiraceae bacterium]|nr:hypothetical protein [Lachnospiraceae bacterium]
MTKRPPFVIRLYYKGGGNYRILADIRDKELVIIVVEVGHRSSIYKQ